MLIIIHLTSAASRASTCGDSSPMRHTMKVLSWLQLTNSCELDGCMTTLVNWLVCPLCLHTTWPVYLSHTTTSSAPRYVMQRRYTFVSANDVLPVNGHGTPAPSVSC